jgi:hypothetical protein
MIARPMSSTGPEIGPDQAEKVPVAVWENKITLNSGTIVVNLRAGDRLEEGQNRVIDIH